MGHSAAVYGCCLVVYGGFYGEDNQYLNDFVVFDLELKAWI